MRDAKCKVSLISCHCVYMAMGRCIHHLLAMLSLHPNSVFLQCFLSTDYGLARRLSSPYRPIISVTFINQFWPSMDVQIISTCFVCRQTLPVGVQIKTVWGFWPEEGERMSLLLWWRPQYCHSRLFLVCEHFHASFPSNKLLCNVVEGMSDLTTLTHGYQKAASPLPASQSTWISQSCVLKQVLVFFLEGSVASVFLFESPLL